MDLFAAINQICNGNEAKVLLTLLGCKGDGSFSPSSAYVQRLSGITQTNNYYKIRSQLEKKGLIQIAPNGNIHIDTKKIMAQAKQDESKTNQEKTHKPQTPQTEDQTEAEGPNEVEDELSEWNEQTSVSEL